MADERKKNPAAVALGRLGGRKRAAKLSAEELSEQGKRAAGVRWSKAKLTGESPAGDGSRPVSGNPEPVRSELVREVQTNLDGRDSNVIQALREQGYEVGEPAMHPDGFRRINVRSHEVSAWVTTGKELLDLAAGRVTLEEIVNRRRNEHRTAAAGGQR
ncbi:MAG: phage major capsid protein [Acidobacteriia bacterium]|nr:phage major capsid protein [Terriglobia bacterium]